METFINPYASLKTSGEGNRITMDVSKDDYLLIKLIRPGSGTISGVMGLLWSKLCNELRKRNITDNSQCLDFEQFVAGCCIVSADEYQRLSNSPVGGPVQQADGPNDGGRTPRVRRQHKSKSAEHTDVR